MIIIYNLGLINNVYLNTLQNSNNVFGYTFMIMIMMMMIIIIVGNSQENGMFAGIKVVIKDRESSLKEVD